jgi:RND family efflux transporter MFP subunit
MILVAGAAILLGGAVVPLLSRRDTPVSAQTPEAPLRPVVQVALARSRPMRRTLRLSGTLKSGSEATLSPKAGGKVTGVFVKEGQAVRQGQVLVRLDPSDTQRQVEQAEAGVRAARATWEKAQEGERLKRLDVERRVSEAQSGVQAAKLQVEKAEAGIRMQGRAGQAEVERAQGGVDAARSALAKAKQGARPEQRRQAEIGVRQAQRGVDQAKRSLDDVEFLYNKGGLPRVKLDEAREGYQKAQDGLAQARAQLDLLDAGATPEDVSAAEAQVRSAEAGLAAAKAAANREELDNADLAAARGQLQRAQEGLKAAIAGRAELEVARSDIRAARADYDRALAASRLAAQQLGGSEVTSPVDGLVTAVNTHLGEMAGPGQPLVTVVGTAGVYLEAAAPSRLVGQLRVGQGAVVSVDALRGETFRGTVRSVGNVAGPDGRSYPVEIAVSARAGLLKPGGFARAEVSAEAHEAAVTVPLEALKTLGDKTSVWVVRNRRLVAAPVEVPVQDERWAMVRGDVRPGDPVLLSSAPGLAPGDEVEARVAN